MRAVRYPAQKRERYRTLPVDSGRRRFTGGRSRLCYDLIPELREHTTATQLRRASTTRCERPTFERDRSAAVGERSKFEGERSKFEGERSKFEDDRSKNTRSSVTSAVSPAKS